MGFTPKKLTELIVPHDRAVTVETWRAAGALAGLRRATNEAHRAADRDRGDRKNRLNDIMGAVIELVAVAVCEHQPGMTVHHNLLDLNGPVDDVDLVLERSGQQRRLEVKGHFLEPRKRFFAINERAHERSVRRGAHGYLPIVSKLGSGVCRVGRIVTVFEIDSWRRQNFGHNDPAVAVDINAFIGDVLDDDRRALHQRLVTDEAAIGVALEADHAAIDLLDHAKATDFSLSGLSSGALIVALTEFITGS